MRNHCFSTTTRALCALALLTAFGCNRDGDEGVAEGSEVLEGSRGDEEVREQCVADGVQTEAVDVNNDGRPDIRHAIANGVRRCTEIDMNFDGRTDVTRFYGPDGQTPVREEHDFDFDGRMDQIAYFENGALVRKELDTNFNRRIDTWMWCASGLVARAERDRTNDGDVDTWEEYEDGVLAQASYDDDNDGTPEKWEVFTAGRLSAIRFDTDRDGEADREEQVPPDQAGPADERITCEILPEESEEEAAAPANGTVPAEGADAADAGEGAATDEVSDEEMENVTDGPEEDAQ